MTAAPLKVALSKILEAMVPQDSAELSTVALFHRQRSDAAFEPSSMACQMFLEEQRHGEGDLTTMDLQQLGVAPVEKKRATQSERRRPPVLLLLHLGGWDEKPSRALVDSGAEVSIVHPKRVPLALRECYQATRLD